MANSKKETVPAVEENEVRKKSFEQYFNENRKKVLTVFCVVVVIAAAALAYSKFIYQPRCEEAMQQLYPAEMLFEQGEFETALKGDGNVLGFDEIISEYGAKAGSAVYFYAGVCALQLGDNEAALNYLNQYKGKDAILAARAISCKGDAYVGLGDYENAVASFKAAAAVADNTFAATYLVKAGVTYEKLGNKAAALECYRTVKDKYPASVEAYEIDSYIAGVEE